MNTWPSARSADWRDSLHEHRHQCYIHRMLSLVVQMNKIKFCFDSSDERRILAEHHNSTTSLERRKKNFPTQSAAHLNRVNFNYNRKSKFFYYLWPCAAFVVARNWENNFRARDERKMGKSMKQFNEIWKVCDRQRSSAEWKNKLGSKRWHVKQIFLSQLLIIVFYDRFLRCLP